MNRLSLLPCALALIVSLACGSTSSETTVGPSPARCGVSVAADPRNFPHTGGSGSLAVVAARECAWSAAAQAAWISLAGPAEGQGDGTIGYTVAPNPAASPRQGAVTVGGQSAAVTQQGAPCTFELDRRSFELGAAQASGRILVQAPAGCTWSAASSVPWIAIVEGSSGNGAGEVRFQAAANAAPAPRTGRLDVAGVEVTVRQLAAGSPAPPPEPGDCTYALEPTAAEIGPDQTDGAFAVLTDGTCSWNAVSDAGWLTIVSGADGTGAGSVSYRAAANPSGPSRTGRITVEGAVFTVTQEGPPSLCGYEIEPTSRSFGSSGGTGEIEVEAEAVCPWTAQSTVGWIRITSGGIGLGDGEVDYAVDPNSGPARTGTIRVAGLDFTVNQSASLVTVTGAVTNLSGSCPNTTFAVDDQDVRTTSATSFRGGSCGGRLRNGTDVRVTGTIGSDGVLTATEVRF